MQTRLTVHQIFCCLVVLITGTFCKAQAPTHTAKFAPVLHPNVNGFYEYLPRNYQIDTDTKYPLIVFFHAGGETGSVPNKATLDTILTWGPPKLINNGLFPDSFYVGGKWFKFIVISPQIKSGAWSDPNDDSEASTVAAVVDYAKANYRVDLNRIYMCGMSMGGGATWEYAGSSSAAASELAAIAVACGANGLTAEKGGVIAAAKLPVLATHNIGDTVVSYQVTDANVYQINSYIPAINPAPRVVKWQGGDHNVWSRTYEDINPGITSQGYTGNLRDTLGMNVYEWMLQFSRANHALPVSWTSFTVAAVNGAAALRWTVEQPIVASSYTIERSSDGINWTTIATIPAQNTQTAGTRDYQYTDQEMLKDSSYYRIRQTDADGQYTYSPIQKLVSTIVSKRIKVFPNPFKDQVVINYTATAQQNIIVKLVDASGHLLQSQKYTVVIGTNTITISNKGHLSRGLYYTILESESGTPILQKRLLKE